MQKKLTITVDEDVYEGLQKVVGRRKIGKFLQDLARPLVVRSELEPGYEAMAADEAREAERSNGPKPRAETSIMKRGEVWWVNFDWSLGGEIRKKCPGRRRQQ